MPKLVVELLESVVASSAVASGRRKPVELSFVRKPVPLPDAETSAMMSGRIAIVVVRFAPDPCVTPVTPVSVATVAFATLTPEALPRLAPRSSKLPPLLTAWAVSVVIVSNSAPPAPPLSVMTPPPFCTVSVPIVSLTATEALPPSTNVPPWIVRFLLWRRFVRYVVLSIVNVPPALIVSVAKLLSPLAPERVNPP